jgi:hypothetical protein
MMSLLMVAMVTSLTPTTPTTSCFALAIRSCRDDLSFDFMYLDVSHFEPSSLDRMLELGWSCDIRMHKSLVYVCWRFGCVDAMFALEVI